MQPGSRRPKGHLIVKFKAPEVDALEILASVPPTHPSHPGSSAERLHLHSSRLQLLKFSDDEEYSAAHDFLKGHKGM